MEFDESDNRTGQNEIVLGDWLQKIKEQLL